MYSPTQNTKQKLRVTSREKKEDADHFPELRVLRTQTLRTPILVGTQGYSQRFPLFKPEVGRYLYIALLHMRCLLPQGLQPANICPSYSLYFTLVFSKISPHEHCEQFKTVKKIKTLTCGKAS